MKRLGIVLSLLVTGSVVAAGYGALQEGVSDRVIGLSKTSVFDVPVPPAVHPNERFPGDNPLLPRLDPLSPPRIPHTVGDDPPITRSDNLCTACHVEGEKVEGEPTPIPESHFVDYRNAPGKKGDKLVGARYYCISCHVPETDAKPLVKNRFKP